MKVVIAIPSRIGSTRLPEKALADICGEPLVVRVWRRCSQMRGAAAVLVATDDERICSAVRAAGGVAVLTAASHRSGTDRIAEAVRGERCDLVVNVQGDEPFVEAAPLEALVEAFAGGAPPEAATLATPIHAAADLLNPAVVKVLVGRDGYAVYFSRHPIPWREGLRGAGLGPPSGRCGEAIDTAGYLRHIGVYAFRPEFLRRFTELEPTFGERSERLEQLRILEHGHRIRVVLTPWESLAVDTPEDLARARSRAAREAGRPEETGSGSAPAGRRGGAEGRSPAAERSEHHEEVPASLLRHAIRSRAERDRKPPTHHATTDEGAQDRVLGGPQRQDPAARTGTNGSF